jgi:hypothetical protein
MDPIWDYATVPQMANVFVLGCFERWVSIYLQAVRGLNLSWALIESGRAGPRVAVIGGGFAGLACAAGLGRKGVEVTLFEQNRELLQTQKHNRVRSIHPHIHEWPRAGSLEVRAGLPILDWHAGISADMAEEVLRQFAAVVEKAKIRVITGTKVTLDGSAVGWSGGSENFDAVILALGVGVEKSFGNLPLKSYWSDDSIAKIGPHKTHLVTGIGEGGVIDALYLRLTNFSHLEIAQRLAEIPGMNEVEESLLEIEDDIEGLDDHEANGVLWNRYQLLPVPAAVDELLRQRARKDTSVTLNGPEPHALASRADILNRFLISRLIAIGELQYLPGRIHDILEGNRVIFDRTGILGGTAASERLASLADGRETLPFDEIEIRHGTYPALKVGFPDVWERYHPVRVTLPHLVPEPMWPEDWFTMVE